MKSSALAAIRLRFVLRLARVSRALNNVAPAVCQQLCFFGGMAAITYGAWMIYRPAGPIVGGALAMWIATAISQERR